MGFTPHRFVMNELEEEIDLIPHEAIYRLHLKAARLPSGGTWSGSWTK